MQRYDVLAFLARHPIHATAQEIHGAHNRRNPRVSRATVYNCLRKLVRTGPVREVPADGKAARYDANLHKHNHFVCDRCGAVEDLEWFEIPTPGERRVRDYEVIFHGVCARCAG